jgi:Carboxypeptidase regulatory-like domain
LLFRAPSLTAVVSYATLACMVVARIAAVALALCACAMFAQEPSEATLTVQVKDPSGAVIPRAHVVATDDAKGSRFEATADAAGKALIHLSQGTYDLRVEAAGFKGWIEKELEVKGETRRDVVVVVAVGGCGPCFPIQMVPPIELDNLPVEAEIPSIRMEQLVLPARRCRRRTHWF